MFDVNEVENADPTERVPALDGDRVHEDPHTNGTA